MNQYRLWSNIKFLNSIMTNSKQFIFSFTGIKIINFNAGGKITFYIEYVCLESSLHIICVCRYVKSKIPHNSFRQKRSPVYKTN